MKPSHRRLAALEDHHRARLKAQARQFIVDLVDQFDAPDPAEGIRLARRLAARIEAGDLEGLPESIKARPAEAAELARGAADDIEKEPDVIKWLDWPGVAEWLTRGRRETGR